LGRFVSVLTKQKSREQEWLERKERPSTRTTNDRASCCRRVINGSGGRKMGSEQEGRKEKRVVVEEWR